MPLNKKTKTGFLLLLVAGPFLVFLFLHLFGKNQFEIDLYPYQAGYLKKLNTKGPVVVADDGRQLTDAKAKEYFRQWKRLEPFFADKKLKPFVVSFSSGGEGPSVGSLANFWKGKKRVEADADFLGLAMKDTVLETETAKGPSLKRLPPPPRVFLFDQKLNLRGVYGLSNSLYTDTLMLEYKILTNQ